MTQATDGRWNRRAGMLLNHTAPQHHELVIANAIILLDRVLTISADWRIMVGMGHHRPGQTESNHDTRNGNGATRTKWDLVRVD